MFTVPRKLPIGAAICVFAIAGGTVQAQTSKLDLDPVGTKAARLGYFPVRIKLTDQKPAGIKREPAYTGKVQYGIIRVGNGPKSDYIVALDEPEKGDYKIYLDKNRNGDLTDDGDGAWSKRKEGSGRVMYGVNEYTLRASWGTPKRETSSGDYGIAMYRFSNIPELLIYRLASRTGMLTVAGKSHKAILVENDADGVFAKPLDDAGKPMNGAADTHPVWLLVDLNDDGKFARPIDVRSPFKLGDNAYVADIAADGSKLTLKPTIRKVPEAPKVAESRPLLKAGTAAPSFAADRWNGGQTSLSEYKGKVVILDFWATWCGPCQASMPHIEKVYQAVKDKDVVVLGLCVSDEKAAYTKWMGDNKDKYHFNFAFDPAGTDSTKSISGNLFNVSGIPTTYIIDRDGNVADAIVGFEEGDKRVEAALKKLGIDADTK